jgi:parvulin-like peptidyl-prolyl isomerase
MQANNLTCKALMLLSLGLSLNAAEPSEAELKSYTEQKYRVEFSQQTQEAKENLTKEYITASKLSEAVAKTAFKDDLDAKVAIKIVTSDIWAAKFAQTIQPSHEELQKLYVSQNPMVSPRYKLHNILVKDEAKADKILKVINEMKDKQKHLAYFKETAKNESLDFATRPKEGDIGWIDTAKLDKPIQEALKGKEVGSRVKVNLGTIGWQILYIGSYEPERKATFEEAKEVLINIARNEAVGKEIARLTQKGN